MHERPRLIAVYGHRSLDLLQIRQGARGWCDLIWLIDAADPSASAVRPLLERTGVVVDALGGPAQEAAHALAPHEPDGLCTFYDRGMERVATIAELLGLPFHSPATGRALEDKYAQRAMLQVGGIATPPFSLVPPADDGEAQRRLAEGFSYPAVLKPRRASGSWHTFTVAGATELLERLEWITRQATPDSAAGGGAEEMLLEGFWPDGFVMPVGFEADYVSVESIAAGGERHHVAVTGRFPLVPPMRETGFFVPSTLAGPQAGEVLELADATLRALGFAVGCAHTEIKLTPDGPRVIEVNGRIGGGLPEMLALLDGPDLVRLSMRAALGFPLEVPPLAADRVAYRFFYQPPPQARRLLTLEGLDEIRGHPGVEDVWLHHSPGTALDARHGTRTYLFAAVGVAPDHAGVLAVSELLGDRVRATYET